MGFISELCSVESNDSTCFPPTEQIVPKSLLTCITGIADGIWEAFAWKRPFRSSSPRVTPAPPNSPLLLYPHPALGLLGHGELTQLPTSRWVSSPFSRHPIKPVWFWDVFWEQTWLCRILMEARAGWGHWADGDEGHCASHGIFASWDRIHEDIFM